MFERNQYTPMHNQAQYVEAVTKLLKSTENQYHLTLAPVHNLSLRFVIKTLNTFIFFMNQRLYGKRYKKQHKYMQGIVMMENAEMHNPHFHIILRNPNGDLENRYTVEEAVKMVLPKLVCWQESNKGVVSNKRKPYVDASSWKLQTYWNEDQDFLEDYLAKSMGSSGYWHNNPLDNIGVLTIDGVEFAVRDTELSNVRLTQYTAR